MLMSNQQTEASSLSEEQQEMVVNHFKKMTNDRQMLGKKLVELDEDRREHLLVLETLKPLGMSVWALS